MTQQLSMIGFTSWGPSSHETPGRYVHVQTMKHVCTGGFPCPLFVVSAPASTEESWFSVHIIFLEDWLRMPVRPPKKQGKSFWKKIQRHTSITSGCALLEPSQKFAFAGCYFGLKLSAGSRSVILSWLPILAESVHWKKLMYGGKRIRKYQLSQIINALN